MVLTERVHHYYYIIYHVSIQVKCYIRIPLNISLRPYLKMILVLVYITYRNLDSIHGSVLCQYRRFNTSV